MLKIYKSEIQGMVDFWEEIGLDPDYDLNTDGRIKGNLVEFKLVFQNTQNHKEQLFRYTRAYNSAAKPIPKYSYLISINERKFIKIDNDTKKEIISGLWDEPKFFIKEFLRQDETIKGWIDEYSIVSYNNKLCTENKNDFKTKEDVKKEFINPKILNIVPFDWEKQISLENDNPDEIGWLHFNMNMLGPFLLKKQLGAFFTPDAYVKISTDMVRRAIERVPEGNDYIIFDRCAGTGNLERFLHEEELAHCVLNTYDYTEWTTLKGLYEGRVKMIIPPTHQSIDYNNGLLLYGDALSEDFHRFCFNSGQKSLFDDVYHKQSKIISEWLNDDKITIIMLENPPFVEPQGGASKGKPTFKIKDKYLYKVMGKEKFRTKNVNRASENLFIWSAFKFYLKQPTDTYILFSPVKYWKSQHIIDKKFVSGYICNRLHFNASEGGIALIEWLNINESNEQLSVKSDLGNRTLKKMYSNPIKLLEDSKENEIIAWLFNLSNIPKPDNGKLINDIDSYEKYRKVQKAYKLCKDNIFDAIPLWIANCYQSEDYTEKEIVMKTADGGKKYRQDKEFLNNAFLWAGISHKNKCLSNEKVQNEFCFNQNTLADKLLEKSKFSESAKTLYLKWGEVLDLIKNTEEYNSNWNYGLNQIEQQINIRIPSGSLNKMGVPIMVPKYRLLNEKIANLKEELSKFYKLELKPYLFKYELLK